MITIVGAGPAGSYLAYLLVKKGEDVTIIEEHENIGNPVQCTGIVTDSIEKYVTLPKYTISAATFRACRCRGSRARAGGIPPRSLWEDSARIAQQGHESSGSVQLSSQTRRCLPCLVILAPLFRLIIVVETAHGPGPLGIDLLVGKRQAQNEGAGYCRRRVEGRQHPVIVGRHRRV